MKLGKNHRKIINHFRHCISNTDMVKSPPHLRRLYEQGIAHSIYPSYTMFKYEGRFAENALGAFVDGEYCFHGAFTYTVLYIVYVYITISCRRKYRAHTHTTPKLKSNVRGKRVSEGSTDVCVDVCLKYNAS